MNEQKKTTLADLHSWVEDWAYTCRINHVSPNDVEVFIENETSRRRYYPFEGALGFGRNGVKIRIGYFESDIVKFEPKDERPEVGEYWKSRGASTFDVSGFITSKAAGLRLMRMVRYILDTDDPKTWLDYREHEPNWIQFKFSAEEFDVEKLDAASRANDGVITEQILRDCLKKVEKED